MAVSQAFIFHFKCYSILHFAVCQLLCWAFLLPLLLYYETGTYQRLTFAFFLKRDIGYFILHVYVPSVIIVILSWISFWISVDPTPDRVSIVLVMVLAIIMMSDSINDSLPKVSYVKSIDIWMTSGFVFLFGCLIENAVVNVLVRMQRRSLTSQLMELENEKKDCGASSTADMVKSPGQKVRKSLLHFFNLLTKLYIIYLRCRNAVQVGENCKLM